MSKVPKFKIGDWCLVTDGGASVGTNTPFDNGYDWEVENYPHPVQVKSLVGTDSPYIDDVLYTVNCEFGDFQIYEEGLTKVDLTPEEIVLEQITKEIWNAKEN